RLLLLRRRRLPRLRRQLLPVLPRLLCHHPRQGRLLRRRRGLLRSRAGVLLRDAGGPEVRLRLRHLPGLRRQLWLRRDREVTGPLDERGHPPPLVTCRLPFAPRCVL